MALEEIEKRIAALEDLEKRLRLLEDINAIKDLHREYMFLLNNREWDQVVDCFAEDGIANIAHHGLRKGKAELSILFRESISKMNSGKGRDGHIAIQPVISVEGNSATGHWLMYVLISDPVTGNALRWVQGRHDCEYIKEEDGRWRFRSLKFTRPWPLQPDSVPKSDE